MTFIKVLLYAVEFLTALLLIAVILVQKSRDEGLGLAFGAGVGESLFGSRAGNVLTRITIILAMVFLVTTLLIGMLSSRQQERSVVDNLPNQPMQNQPLLPASQPAPAGGGEMPVTAPAEAASPAPYAPAELPVSVPAEPAPAAP